MISGSGSCGSHPIQAPGAPSSRPVSQSLPNLLLQQPLEDQRMCRSHGAGTQCVLDGVPPTGWEGYFRIPTLTEINKSNSRGQFVNYTDGRFVTHKLVSRIFTARRWDSFFPQIKDWVEPMNMADLTFTAFVCQIPRNTGLFSSVSGCTDDWVRDHPAALSDQYYKSQYAHTSRVYKEAWKQAGAVSLRQRNNKRSELGSKMSRWIRYTPSCSGWFGDFGQNTNRRARPQTDSYKKCTQTHYFHIEDFQFGVLSQVIWIMLICFMFLSFQSLYLKEMYYAHFKVHNTIFHTAALFPHLPLSDTFCLAFPVSLRPSPSYI